MPQPGYPQMIVVQNQINPYGGAMAPDRRKKDVALLLAVCGLLFGICGAQRFYLRQVGMGILYFFTGGLCVIGQIIDIIQLATMSQQEFDMRYNVIR
jgi:TM2 domain-containing membrane protein YozV